MPEEKYDEPTAGAPPLDPPPPTNGRKVEAHGPRKDNKPTEHRPKGKLGEVPDRVWKHREADLMWAEMLAALPGEQRTPWDLEMRVFTSSPGDKHQVGEAVGGELLQGDNTISPSEAVRRQVTQMHLDRKEQVRGAENYEVWFCWRHNGWMWGRGEIRCASPAEIAATRDAEMRRRAADASRQPYVPDALPPRAGTGWPGSQQQSVATPDYAPYAPPPQSAPAGGDEAATLRVELQRSRENEAYMRARIDDLMDLIGQERSRAAAQPALAAAQPPAPPPPSLADEVKKSVEVLRALGIPVGAPPAAPAPPAPPPPEKPKTVLEQVDDARKLLEALGVPVGNKQAPPPVAAAPTAAEDLLTAAADSFIKKGRSLRTVFRSLGDVFTETAEGAAEAVAEDDPLPFRVHDTGSQWKDGRPVKMPVTAEGKIDWVKVPFHNPFMMEKGMEMAQGVFESAGKIMRAVVVPGTAGEEEAEVVDKTPEDAQDATDKKEGEGGWGASD